MDSPGVIITDSQWWCCAISGEYNITKNLKLLAKIKKLIKSTNVEHIYHVPGHRKESDGRSEVEKLLIRGNNIADELATVV